MKFRIGKAALFVWLLVFTWAGVISWMSTDKFSASTTGNVLRRLGTPEASVGEINHLVRKSAHLTEYALLGMLLSVALVASWPRFYRQRGAVLLTLACALYALGDEAHQAFVPNRTPSPSDVVIDSLGAALGIYLLFRFRHLRKALRSTEPKSSLSFTLDDKLALAGTAGGIILYLLMIWSADRHSPWGIRICLVGVLAMVVGGWVFSRLKMAQPPEE
jgi:VanZ family protein